MKNAPHTEATDKNAAKNAEKNAPQPADPRRRSFLLSSAAGAGAMVAGMVVEAKGARPHAQHPLDRHPQGSHRLDQRIAQARLVRRPGHDRRRGLRQALQGRRAGRAVLLPRQLHRDQRHRRRGRPGLRRAVRGFDVPPPPTASRAPPAKSPPAPAPRARA